MSQDLYSILKKEKSLKKIITDVESTKLIQKHWDNIFGNLAKNLSLGYFKNGILLVEADNPVWVTEINYFKGNLLEKIQIFLGQYKKIKDLKVAFKKKEKTIKNENKDTKMPLQILNFEEAIQRENKEKRNKGYKLCPTCNNVFVTLGECLFCKNKTNLS